MTSASSSPNLLRGPGGYGFLTLTALVMANMIGAGVFTTSGFALADLHTPSRVLAAWAAAGLIALCGAIAYGALASVLAKSGGEYLFLSRWVHPAAGFLAGWVSLLAGFTGAIAFAALTLETYVLPMNGWLAASVIVAGALLHGFRKAPGAWLQNAVVLGKLLLLVLFLFLAFPVLAGRQTDPSAIAAPFSPGAFAEALMWISLSYSGFNAAVYVAGEARKPGQVARALLWGTGLTMLFYLGLNAVFVFTDPEALRGQPEVALIAARALGGGALEALTQTVIPLALFTSVSAMMLAGPRVYAQMAEDGWLPSRLRFSPANPPRAAIALQALLAILLVWISSLRELLTYLGFTLSLSSAAAVASLWLVHHRRLAPVSRWQLTAATVYVLMTLLSAGIGAMLNPWQGLAGLATLATGFLCYEIARRRRAIPPAPVSGASMAASPGTLPDQADSGSA